MDKKKKHPHIDTIPANQAAEWTGKWRKIIEDLNKKHNITLFHEIRAFNMTLGEIEAALWPDPIEHNRVPVAARIYLGCTSDTPSSTNDFKLIVVGVDSDGKDILTSIGDFSHPCPTFCDESSVLNGAQN